ncbi:hypothetical protein KP509_10G012500 [Ceratopteris richardii]|nr:hypothetical protein KP509_10G012500 [Ceratopteris richardii]KAH7426683.1 hypothetical protein KP509_10G012500 [Ceratopteris richardii]
MDDRLERNSDDLGSIKKGLLERGDWRKYVAVKVSTEYDSEESIFLNKVSARFLDGLAKVKASFQREPAGEIRSPIFGFSSKHLSILYDHEERNALVTAIGTLGSRVEMKYLRDIRAQQGELKLIARSMDTKYQAEIGYDIPTTGLPRVSLISPYGEVKLEEEQREEGRALLVNGFVGGKVLNGFAMAEYRDEMVALKYKYKDSEMTISPSLSLPTNSLALAFKRQFDQANKLSYSYNFDSTAWSTVYKYKPTGNFKLKAGYDSEARIGWASAWIGKEESGAKQAPRKCKLQVMLQVPQDDFSSAVVLLKVKKRWDL